MKKWIYIVTLVLAVALGCLLLRYDKQQRRDQAYWMNKAASEAKQEEEKMEEQSEADASIVLEEILNQDATIYQEDDTESSVDTVAEEDPLETPGNQENGELVPIDVGQSASLQFLFVGLNHELYDEVFPLMNQYGYTGIIGISDDQYSFQEGMISRKEFEKMIDAGWKTCLVCPDSSRFDSWYKSFKKEISARSIKDSNMVYFANKDYHTGLNSSIKENDIRVILHQGESDYPVITHEVPFRNWYIGSARLEKDTLMDTLQQLFAEGGNITFSVVMNAQFDANYNLQELEEMLAYLSGYVSDGSLELKDYKSVFRPDANW